MSSRSRISAVAQVKENKMPEITQERLTALESAEKTVKELTATVEELTKKSRELTEGKQKYRDSTESLTKERDELKLELTKLKGNPDEVKKQYEEMFTGLKNQVLDLNNKLRERDVYSVIKDAANKANAHNADIVLSQIKPMVAYDDKGEAFIHTGDGKTIKVNSVTGKPFTLTEATEEYLKQNVYLIKSSGNAGGDSTPSQNQNKSKSLHEEFREGFDALATKTK